MPLTETRHILMCPQTYLLCIFIGENVDSSFKYSEIHMMQIYPELKCLRTHKALLNLFDLLLNNLMTSVLIMIKP